MVTLPWSGSAQSQKALVDKEINLAEILSIPSGSEFQVLFVEAEASFQKVGPLRKELSASKVFSSTLSESLGLGNRKNGWVSDVPFFSLFPKRDERESILYLKFQLQRVQTKGVRRATLLLFGPSREELEIAERKGYEETLVRLMNSVHLWFSSFDPWKETIKSDIDGEKQYEKIRPEVALGSPIFSPVYSGCYFWDITEVVNGELKKDKTITFLLRNENTDLGYGVNIFSSKMHRFWKGRIDKSPRLVIELSD